MYYCVEIIRNEYGNITGTKIISASTMLFPMPRGKECVMVSGPYTDNISLKKATMDIYENIIIEDDNDAIAALANEEEIALRVKRQEFGRRLIAIISIRNDAKSFTQAQIEQFASDYAAINTALLNGSIATAKAQITAITPDGTITTQGDKDALLNEINANETSLGY